MKPGLSIALLFLGGSGLIAGSFGVVSLFLFWRPGLVTAVVELSVVFLMSASLIVAASRLWDRWAPAFGVILFLLGFGCLQTSPKSNDEVQDALRRRAFQVSGGLLAATGAAVYFFGRRRAKI
jgi:hypothetical protein